jgi:hypothetical protein
MVSILSFLIESNCEICVSYVEQPGVNTEKLNRRGTLSIVVEP